MFAISTLLPLASSILSFVFAAVVFKRYLSRPGHHHLLVWGIGMVFYGIGGASEAFTGAFGFNPLVLKIWYLFGAILVAAWLGQGTVFLLARDRWVRITTRCRTDRQGVYDDVGADADPVLQHLRNGDADWRRALLGLAVLA